MTGPSVRFAVLSEVCTHLRALLEAETARGNPPRAARRNSFGLDLLLAFDRSFGAVARITRGVEHRSSGELPHYGREEYFCPAHRQALIWK